MKATIQLAFLTIAMAVLPTVARAQDEPEAKPTPASAQDGPPVDFLRTRIPAWKRVLGTEIIANFRNATIGDVTRVLAAQSRSQIVVSATTKRVPLITRKFHRVPLRTALYLISQDTGLGVDWIYAGSVPQVIKFH